MLPGRGNLARWLQTVSRSVVTVPQLSLLCDRLTGQRGGHTCGRELRSERALLPDPTLCTTPGSQLSLLPDGSRINLLHRPGRVLQDLSCHHSNSPPVSTRSNQAGDPHATQLLAPGQLLFRNCQTTEGLRWLQRENLESRALGDLLGLLPKRCEGVVLGATGHPKTKWTGKDGYGGAGMARGTPSTNMYKSPLEQELRSHRIKGRHGRCRGSQHMRAALGISPQLPCEVKTSLDYTRRCLNNGRKQKETPLRIRKAHRPAGRRH